MIYLWSFVTFFQVRQYKFLERQYQNLALGLVHLQEIAYSEEQHGLITNNHMIHDIKTLDHTHLTSILCWLRTLTWQNRGPFSCDISPSSVSQDFKDRGTERGHRFCRDYIIFHYIRETLRTIERAFLCLSMNNDPTCMRQPL